MRRDSNSAWDKLKDMYKLRSRWIPLVDSGVSLNKL